MDTKKIRALLTALEKGSLTAAAEEMGYTQSGLTHMMNSLEDELGIRLLVRSKGGVRLSPAGRELLPQMNARCLYLAGMLAFACVNGTRRLAIAIVLELISLCSYMEAIFSFTVIPMNVLSLLAIACAAALALELMGKLGIKGAQIGESDA